MSAQLDEAVTAFRAVEQTRFRLAKRERYLTLAVLALEDDDKGAYFELTSEILREFEAKREKEKGIR